jgi:hypothetical protein
MKDITAARIVGSLFLISTLSMIIGSGMIEELWRATDYLTSITENRSDMILGALLKLVNSIAVVGIGVVMYPILKRYNETIAMAYLSSRVMEGIILAFGIISLLSLLTISREYIKLETPDVAYFEMLGSMAINGNFRAFLFAMILLAIGSVMFCYLTYSAKLLPKSIAIWGVISYLILLVGLIATMFGYDILMMSFIPGAFFEFGLPFWLFFKGFNTTPDDSCINSGSETGKTEDLKQALV